MKIIYVLYNLGGYGGMKRVEITKANYLVDILGYDITFILFKSEKIEYTLSPKVKIIDLKINIYHQPVLRRLFRTIKLIYKIKKLLLHFKADFVISIINSNETFWLPLLHDGSIKILECHTSRASDIFLSKTIRQKVSWFLTKINIKRSDYFIVLTERDKKLWSDICEPIVLPNALNEFPTKLSTVVNNRVIAVGRLSYEKGFETLIDIWDIVMKKNKNWVLYLFGSGNEYNNLNNKIKLLGLENSFFIKSPTEKIMDEYRSSSIFVMTSKYEGLPTALIEAASCGLPCISFDINCGPSDLIEDGKNGYLIQYDVIDSFANKLVYLMNNYKVRKSMGKYSVKKAQSYKEEEVMNKWKILFESSKTR